MFVSIPKRVSEALKRDLTVDRAKEVIVSIPKRVSEALKLSKPTAVIGYFQLFQSLKGFQRL